ncbi:carbonic anhydrase [Salimicrobium sp. PL1-032A]|uniref:carbonic anhydrase n=1 Tax=Salimicrobium sp. PL1-032A TaxID=3095364 RepID=UPI003260396C
MSFATAINCMDGRVQLPIIHWMKENYGVEYIDMITEAGPNRVLLQGSSNQLDEIKNKVLVSTEKHDSKVIAIAGHHDCAGNPVDRSQKEKEIKRSVELVEKWDLGVTVLGLFVNENWEVEVVTG